MLSPVVSETPASPIGQGIEPGTRPRLFCVYWGRLAQASSTAFFSGVSLASPCLIV